MFEFEKKTPYSEKLSEAERKKVAVANLNGPTIEKYLRLDREEPELRIRGSHYPPVANDLRMLGIPFIDDGVVRGIAAIKQLSAEGISFPGDEIFGVDKKWAKNI